MVVSYCRPVAFSSLVACLCIIILAEDVSISEICTFSSPSGKEKIALKKRFPHIDNSS